jgi:hypothetical protein
VILERLVTGEHILSIDVHGAAATDPVTTRSAVCKAAIVLVLDLPQSIEDGSSCFQRKNEFIEVRPFIHLRIETLDTDRYALFFKRTISHFSSSL